MPPVTLSVALPAGLPHTEAGTTLLDERQEWQAFSRPVGTDGTDWESYLAIEGMHCPACSLAIEQALNGLPGVRGVSVNGATAIARITWSPQDGRPSQWWPALRKAGYGAIPAGDQLAALSRHAAGRLLLWRWLVAGFCMMQVMMYATPAYVAGPGEMTPDVAALLRWASCLLTLPVLLFSCQPFFAAAWRDLRAGRVGMDVPVALGVAIAFGASVASTIDPQGVFAGEAWYDSVTMFVFFLLSGRLLEQRLRGRTAGALEALARRLPQTAVRVKPDGTLESVAVRHLAAGDQVEVRAGEIIPADGKVLTGRSRVDEALLTGESTPLARAAGDPVVAGSHNLTGTLRVAVERVGAATRHGEIVALMERAAADKPKLAQLADRIASPFLVFVLVSAAGAALWWWPQGPGQALSVAVAVLIVTCPCALSLATPAASLAAAGALARRGVLVRRLEALEAAASLDTVVFDKTGTLTVDRMSVQAIHTRPGTAQGDALRFAAALARHSLHPASRAIAAMAGSVGWTASGVEEHPGAGVTGLVAGDSGWQPRRLRLGSAAFCRAAGGAATAVHLADDAGWIASFELDETLRPGAMQAIGTLQRMRLDVEVLSGDHDAAVQRLALRAGIPRAAGGSTPAGKLARVESLQAAGRRVAMVGDGMNDGPVLARADVSIAMGEGVPVAQARSDFIVLGGRLDAVPLLLRQARRARRVMRQNLGWAAGYNAVCVPLALAGAMPPWLAGLGMALSSLGVVANAARLSVLRED
ncbi:cadmium-translocating P-type ATPase [Caenimonas sedimenti]|uniref:Cadmium-translocating P-type ATPase n=1 Tax=Caenimonas sedimenti TaxID=2596921 RepID=A0A562ZVP9_9BURK|nr:cation-translocating P-type ATPase [Caenimonas sedimenti]TWO72689.1 cadmium-translocating P-type ATPase [Caenimonas sedimenti]